MKRIFLAFIMILFAAILFTPVKAKASEVEDIFDDTDDFEEDEYIGYVEINSSDSKFYLDNSNLREYSNRDMLVRNSLTTLNDSNLGKIQKTYTSELETTGLAGIYWYWDLTLDLEPNESGNAYLWSHASGTYSVKKKYAELLFIPYQIYNYSFSNCRLSAMDTEDSVIFTFTCDIEISYVLDGMKYGPVTIDSSSSQEVKLR